MKVHKECLKQNFRSGDIKMRVSFCSSSILKSGLKVGQMKNVSMYMLKKYSATFSILNMQH